MADHISTVATVVLSIPLLIIWRRQVIKERHELRRRAQSARQARRRAKAS